MLTPAQHEATSKKLGLTREQEDEWHRQHPTPAILTPAQHDTLMQKLGISKEHDPSGTGRISHLQAVNTPDIPRRLRCGPAVCFVVSIERKL